MRQQQRGEERRVIPFVPSLGKPRLPRGAEADLRGAILLFTGVRYERIIEPSESTPATKAGTDRDPRS